jgi:DNA (cytosine-5)-methyltransferase 1
MTRRVLDLFCGAGGFSYGFEQTGAFRVLAGVDLDATRVSTFARNHPHAQGVEGDVRTVSLRTLPGLADPLDVLVGGPPCQGFSSLRPFRALALDDPRNSLLEHYLLAVNALHSTWFVLENVVGLLTHARGAVFAGLLDGLRAIGYRVDWRILNAAFYGVPQYRERVVVVGHRDGLPFLWPEPTHYRAYRSMAGRRPEVLVADPRRARALPRPVSVGDALDDLPVVQAGETAFRYDKPPRTPYQYAARQGDPALTHHSATHHSAATLALVRHAGANLHALPEVHRRRGFSSSYSRLAADEPSTTLTVNFVYPSSNRCIHPSQDRALTPREGARLQSFPDRFIFVGTLSAVVAQIGNAVPPRLGEVLAEALLHSEAP